MMDKRSSRPNGWVVTVVMMEEMGLDDWDENTEKKNDQDEVDGMKQEVDSKGKGDARRNERFVRNIRDVERW